MVVHRRLKHIYITSLPLCLNAPTKAGRLHEGVQDGQSPDGIWHRPGNTAPSLVIPVTSPLGPVDVLWRPPPPVEARQNSAPKLRPSTRATSLVSRSFKVPRCYEMNVFNVDWGNCIRDAVGSIAFSYPIIIKRGGSLAIDSPLYPSYRNQRMTLSFNLVWAECPSTQRTQRLVGTGQSTSPGNR